MSKDKSIKKENNKKEPAKNLKEKRADKKAKQEEKKRNGWRDSALQLHLATVTIGTTYL